MDSESLAFKDICPQVRFKLDAPQPPSSGEHRFVADFVAQVSSTALRVHKSSVPTIHEATVRVLDRLTIDAFPEVFVRNDESPNAFALNPSNDERLVIILNSGIVKLLTPIELEFVIAHELGHFGMSHRQLDLHDDHPSSELAFFQAQSHQRCQEISADRIGLIGSPSIDVAAKVIIKLASGLADDQLQIDVPAFISQLDRDSNEVSRDWELSMSHPSLPLRLWALIQFSHASIYNTIADKGTFGQSMDEIESRIVEQFNSLGDGRLSTLEEDCYSDAVLWSAMALILHDNLIEKDEQLLLKQLVGEQFAGKAIEFVREHGKQSALNKLSESIQSLRNTSSSTRRKYIETVSVFANVINLNIDDVIDLHIINGA